MPIKSKSGLVFNLPTEAEEVEIRHGIDADADARELADSELRQLRPVGRPKAATTKQAVSLRLSPEVVRYFKSTGQGWQTRMDAVLKAYVATRHER